MGKTLNPKQLKTLLSPNPEDFTRTARREGSGHQRF